MLFTASSIELFRMERIVQMAIITTTKPDPRYYVAIMQLPDLTWSSEQMVLDDMHMYLPGFNQQQDSQNVIIVPGLKSQTAMNVTEQAAILVQKFAPADVQRNALYTLSHTPTDANSKATMDWVASVNSYRDTQVANVMTLTFDQLVAYVVPVGVPPWPAPPSFLTPH
jgi:hypothetical protein